MALRASVNVSQHDAHAFFATQFFFVATFHAEFSDEVAALIIIIVGNVFVVHFSNIAEKVRPKASGVVANGAFFNGEAFEAEEFLAENGELLCGNLAHEELRRIARIADFRLDFVHALDIEIFRDANGLAKVERIDAALVVHDDHDVVRRLIVDKEPPFAIENQSARGILDFFAESIGVGILLIVVAHQLEREETDEIDDDNSNRYAA